MIAMERDLATLSDAAQDAVRMVKEDLLEIASDGERLLELASSLSPEDEGAFLNFYFTHYTPDKVMDIAMGVGDAKVSQGPASFMLTRQWSSFSRGAKNATLKQASLQVAGLRQKLAATETAEVELSAKLTTIHAKDMCWKKCGRPIDAILLPCAHLELCYECAKDKEACNFCGEDVDSVEKVYFNA